MLRNLLIFIFLLVIAPCSHSDILVNLYESEVVVSDRDDLTFERAARAGLLKVLVKLSGDSAVFEKSQLDQIFGPAKSLVVRYGYIQEDSGLLRLKITFDKEAVLRKALAAGVPIWTANRSAVMVLVSFQDNMERKLLNSQEHEMLQKSLDSAFSERGVPVRYPLWDLFDHMDLTVDSIWKVSAEMFSYISNRYDVNEILVGKLSRLSTGRWIGEWIFKDDEKIISRYFDVLDSEKMFARGADLVAKTMATRFSIKANVQTEIATKLSIVGLDSYVDYVNLVLWLESLEMIEEANLEKIDMFSLQLRLLSRASTTDLAKIINLNSDLIPIQSEDNFGRLIYEWNDRNHHE